MFVFHPGTVEQSNPDAGDAGTSDNHLMGAWERTARRMTGKVVEITADRPTHKLAGRGEMKFKLRLKDDQLKGELQAMFYDAEHKPERGPIAAILTANGCVRR